MCYARCKYQKGIFKARILEKETRSNLGALGRKLRSWAVCSLWLFRGLDCQWQVEEMSCLEHCKAEERPGESPCGSHSNIRAISRSDQWHSRPRSLSTSSSFARRFMNI